MVAISTRDGDSSTDERLRLQSFLADSLPDVLSVDELPKHSQAV